MKKILTTFACLVMMVISKSQDIKPAEPGVMYGIVAQKGDPVKITDLENALQENKFSGKITCKVAEVCQAKGCWIRLQKPMEQLC